VVWPAGILCAVVSQPADNLVSKLAANPNATINSVVSEMGMWQLTTRGLGLRIVMVGTLTGLQWGIYDAYKVHPEHPPSMHKPLCAPYKPLCAPCAPVAVDMHEPRISIA
jgi:hypothetical protein